ncbi:MAG: aminopeptidase P family N-terminal domain-containing protein [Gemmatimonadetes bacterium]|nr:aminopeptidase P family N-terminal domain-containing protein [Gemmatimonadota bacterium]
MTVPVATTAAPSRAELAERLDRVRARMRSADVDVYVCFDPVNIYYLTNFANYVHERPFLLLIPLDGLPVMVAPLLETSHVRARAGCDLAYATYAEFPAPSGANWFDVFRTLIPTEARVGVESAMPIRIFERTPGTKVVVDVIEEARLVKTPCEIARNVHACQIVTAGHEKLLRLSPRRPRGGDLRWRDAVHDGDGLSRHPHGEHHGDQREGCGGGRRPSRSTRTASHR